MTGERRFLPGQPIIDTRDGRPAPSFRDFLLRVDQAVANASVNATWGSIGGNFNSQGDLVAALATKANVAHTHVLSDITDVVPEQLVPAGGTLGQALIKSSANDYDTEWGDVAASGGGDPAIEDEAGSGDGDANFGSVTALFKFEGANNDTTTTDSSSENMPIVFTGPRIDTAQFRFGSSSAFFDGQNDFATLDNSSLRLIDANQPYTIEAFVRINSFAERRTIFSTRAQGGNQGGLLFFTDITTGKLRFVAQRSDGALAVDVHGDVVPISEVLTDPGRADGVVALQVSQALVAEDDAPAEGVVGAVSLDDHDLVRGVPQLQRNCGVEASRASAEAGDAHARQAGGARRTHQADRARRRDSSRLRDSPRLRDSSRGARFSTPPSPAYSRSPGALGPKVPP